MIVAYDFFPGGWGEEVSKTGFLCVTASVLIGTTKEGYLYRCSGSNYVCESLHAPIAGVPKSRTSDPHQHAELCEPGGGGSWRFLSQLLLLALPTRDHDVS